MHKKLTALREKLQARISNTGSYTIERLDPQTAGVSAQDIVQLLNALEEAFADLEKRLSAD